jgi:4-oxalocrotonate tautomerase family enzyme
MPIIQISLVAGRDSQSLENCIREVARAASVTLGAPLETVRVMLNEYPPDRFAVGDRLKSEPVPAKAGTAP